MKKHNLYNNNFYENRHVETVYSAEVILSILLETLPKLEKVIDIGCGVGTWLSVLKKKGVPQIQGIEGSWVKEDDLKIPKKDFKKLNLEKTIDFNKKLMTA